MHLIPNPSVSINTIFEDGDIIIIAKPAGIPVYPIRRLCTKGPLSLLKKSCHSREGGNLPHQDALDPRWSLPRTLIRGEDDIRFSPLFQQARPPSGHDNTTLANGLIARWPELKDGGPVHRLDNDTSGIMIVAKSSDAFNDLRRQFEKKTVFKEYTALVYGEPPSSGVIDTPIIHDPRNKKKMKVSGPSKGVQEAHTVYKVLEKYLAGRYSLLNVQIKTGVRHQIRVHLASIGHPIVGDKLYKGKRGALDKTLNLPHHFLHASRVGFVHPSLKTWIEFKCGLPDDLRKVLTKLDIV